MERERDGEKHQWVIVFHTPTPTGDLARNSGTCPDWESNQRPFDSQASTQPSEPYQQGPFVPVLWAKIDYGVQVFPL